MLSSDLSKNGGDKPAMRATLVALSLLTSREAEPSDSAQ